MSDVVDAAFFTGLGLYWYAAFGVESAGIALLSAALYVQIRQGGDE